MDKRTQLIVASAIAKPRKRGRKRRQPRAVHPLLAAQSSPRPRKCTTTFCQQCKDYGGTPTLGGDCRWDDGTISYKPKPGGDAPSGRGFALAGARQPAVRLARVIRQRRPGVVRVNGGQVSPRDVCPPEQPFRCNNGMCMTDWTLCPDRATSFRG